MKDVRLWYNLVHRPLAADPGETLLCPESGNTSQPTKPQIVIIHAWTWEKRSPSLKARALNVCCVSFDARCLHAVS